MDALEFLSERKRMCNCYKDCCDCPLEAAICTGSSTMPDEDYKRIIAIVEQWSKEHPIKTRQSVLLAQSRLSRWVRFIDEFEIEDAPAADVAPVVHARWVDGKCSNCGVDTPTDDAHDAIFENECRFCYYCGAMMDGGDSNALN